MPWRPTMESSFLTKNHFQWNLFSSSELNQFTALGSFYLVVNKYRILWGLWEEAAFTSPSKGLFHHFNQGQTFINGTCLSFTCLDDVIKAWQTKNTSMIQVSFPQTCRDMQVSYVPSAVHLSASALLFLHLSIFMKIKILSRNTPKLNMRKREKVGLVFFHSEVCEP